MGKYQSGIKKDRLPPSQSDSNYKAKDPLAPSKGDSNKDFQNTITLGDRNFAYQFFDVVLEEEKAQRTGLIMKDITEEKLLLDKLTQADKLSGLGTLAAGIAHEMNNPLYSVMGFTEAILEEKVTEELIHDASLLQVDGGPPEARSEVQLRPGVEVDQQDHVAGQEEHRAEDLLRRDGNRLREGPAGRSGRDHLEGRRERHAESVTRCHRSLH